MIRIITSGNLAADAQYLVAFAALRHRVFVERLGWNVPLASPSKGLEYDQFDTADATYIVVCDARGRVSAGLRLLRTTAPCLLYACFADLVGNAVLKSDRVFEVTRFVVDPDAARASKNAPLVRQLLWGLFSYGLREGITNFVSVSYVGMERMLRKAGCRFRRLGLPRRIDGRLVVALSFDVTAEIVAAIESKLAAPRPFQASAPVECVVAGQSLSTAHALPMA